MIQKNATPASYLGKQQIVAVDNGRTVAADIKTSSQPKDDVLIVFRATSLVVVTDTIKTILIVTLAMMEPALFLSLKGGKSLYGSPSIGSTSAIPLENSRALIIQ